MAVIPLASEAMTLSPGILHWGGHGILFMAACRFLAAQIRKSRARADFLEEFVGLSTQEVRQILFLRCVARFLCDTQALGYFATIGEGWRSPETCALYASEGKGILHSFHPERLAIDLNFFRQGKLITTAEEYAPLGRLWESYSTSTLKCTAGVFFKTRVDADHFSVDEF